MALFFLNFLVMMCVSKVFIKTLVGKLRDFGLRRAGLLYNCSRKLSYRYNSLISMDSFSFINCFFYYNYYYGLGWINLLWAVKFGPKFQHDPSNMQYYL